MLVCTRNGEKRSMEPPLALVHKALQDCKADSNYDCSCYNNNNNSSNFLQQIFDFLF